MWRQEVFVEWLKTWSKSARDASHAARRGGAGRSAQSAGSAQKPLSKTESTGITAASTKRSPNLEKFTSPSDIKARAMHSDAAKAATSAGYTVTSVGGKQGAGGNLQHISSTLAHPNTMRITMTASSDRIRLLTHARAKDGKGALVLGYGRTFGSAHARLRANMEKQGLKESTKAWTKEAREASANARRAKGGSKKPAAGGSGEAAKPSGPLGAPTNKEVASALGKGGIYNGVSRHKDGSWSVKDTYFYRGGRTPENRKDRVAKALDAAIPGRYKITDVKNNYRDWPKLSFFEVKFRVHPEGE